ncbi:UNVERIFIED_CONTAM: hypothetical protein FKN15_018044 [Acipenser sinensis]
MKLLQFFMKQEINIHIQLACVSGVSFARNSCFGPGLLDIYPAYFPKENESVIPQITLRGARLVMDKTMRSLYDGEKKQMTIGPYDWFWDFVKNDDDTRDLTDGEIRRGPEREATGVAVMNQRSPIRLKPSPPWQCSVNFTPPHCEFPDKVGNGIGVFHALDIITMNEKVLKGANVSFHCRFPNEEKLNLTEYTFYLCKDGMCIAMRKWGGESGVTFSIKNVTRYDSGNYSCVYSEQKRALEEVTVPMRNPIIFLQISVPIFVVASVLCTLGSIAVLSVAMALLITLFKHMKTLKMEPGSVYLVQQL